jgi:hypothetical protein
VYERVNATRQPTQGEVYEDILVKASRELNALDIIKCAHTLNKGHNLQDKGE